MSKEDVVIPDLPEGMFFRVETNVLGIYPWVTLRKKQFIGSTEVMARWTRQEFNSVEEEISYLIDSMWKDYTEDIERERTRTELEGDYFG